MKTGRITHSEYSVKPHPTPAAHPWGSWCKVVIKRLMFSQNRDTQPERLTNIIQAMYLTQKPYKDIDKYLLDEFRNVRLVL